MIFHFLIIPPKETFTLLCGTQSVLRTWSCVELFGQTGADASRMLSSFSLCPPARALFQDPGGHRRDGKPQELGQSQQRSHGALQVGVHLCSNATSHLSKEMLSVLKSTFAVQRENRF